MTIFHFAKIPNLVFVSIMSDSAKRTIRFAFFLRFGGLDCINRFFSCFVKNPDIKQFCIDRTAKDIFKNTFAIFYIRIGVKIFLPRLMLWPDYMIL